MLTIPDERADRLRALPHDIRTPIGHILGYADLVLEQIAEMPPARLADGGTATEDRLVALRAEQEAFADMLRRVRAAGRANVADLPIQLPATFQLVISLRTAQALGLTISDGILARAQVVIR